MVDLWPVWKETENGSTDKKAIAMKAQPQFNNGAEHAGAVMGRAWRCWLRQDRRLVGWLASQGLPRNIAKAVSRVIKFIVLAVLLYAITWLALLLIFAFLAAWAARNAEWNEEEDQPEWRQGLAGYGLYTSGGYRIDPHDPEDEQD
jgi:hypothetical protein